MNKKLVATLLGMALPFALSNSAQAETVLEKVARTGVLTMGTNYEIIPYVYIDGDQNLVGYSMDVADRIRAELETVVGREVTLETVELETEGEQIMAILNEEIDIACATRFTWERERFVDFSLSYGISGLRLLSMRNSGLGAPETLAGKRIGVFKKGLTAQLLNLMQPEAIQVFLTDIETAVDALDAGEVDAVLGDTVILAGLVLTRDPAQYQLSPSEPYVRNGIACMVPEDNSGFLDRVNYAIVKLMEGYVTGEPESEAIINQWFGPDGLVSMPPILIQSFFENIIMTREQIPLDDN